MDNHLVILNEYIRGLNTNFFFSGEIELKLISDIFNIDVLILEYKNEFNGYNQYSKIINNINDKIKPVMILLYTYKQSNGHYDIIHIKDNIIINNYIKNIPKYINNRYNYYFLRKINVIMIKYNINPVKSNNIQNSIIIQKFKIDLKTGNFEVKNKINDKTLNRDIQIESKLLSSNDNYINNNNQIEIKDDDNGLEQSIKSEYEEKYILKIEELKNFYYPPNKKSINI